MLHRPIRSPVRRAVSAAIGRRPTALTISQLLPSGAGRVAAIYSDPARPSYDECIQKNMAAIAAGRPQDCVLFSDAAGQTPVVYPIGAGQGKGLLLDRSAGLVRGVELRAGFSPAIAGTGPAPATYNTGTGVGTVNRLVTADFSFVRIAGLTSGKYFEVSVTNTGGITLSIRQNTTGFVVLTVSPGATVTALISTATYQDIAIVPHAQGDGSFVLNSVRELPGHHQQQPTAAARGEFSRRYNQLLATATLATQSITAIATQYRLYFTGAGTVTLSGAATGTYSAGSHTITCTAGSLTLTVAGSVLTGDLRFEADATIGLPEYQRVTTASDYDEVGFPTYHRAVTDDWAKSHMNPNGATKAYVFWAGQIMSEAAIGILAETGVDSSSVNGTMRMTGPRGNGTNQRSFFSRGTLNADGAAIAGASIAPSRSVFVGNSNIPGDVCLLYINGISVGSSVADQGTGTYTEQDVFEDARAGTTLFANNRKFAPPLILFLQPADSLNASHLAKLQRGYAKAVGVTL